LRFSKKSAREIPANNPPRPKRLWGQVFTSRLAIIADSSPAARFTNPAPVPDCCPPLHTLDQRRLLKNFS
jgi:hypothetical protein